MNKVEKKIVPELRFPDFVNDGEWEKKSLHELGKLVNGLTYSPNDIRDKGLLVLRSSNIQNGQITLNDRVYVTPQVKGANLVKPGDILICIRNGSKALIGKNAMIPSNTPLSTHGAFMTIFRSENAIFTFQLFQTDAYIKQVNADLGATINSINGSNFLKYSFFVPNPKEQHKIASCLSSLDDVIASQVEKLKALKSHKKGLMQNLFPQIGEKVPKLRFLEFVTGDVWVNGQIGDLVNAFMGNAFKSEDFEDNGIQLVRMGNLYQGELQLNRAPVFLPFRFKEEYSKFVIKPLDILMSMTGTIGKRDYGFVIQTAKNCPSLLLNQRVLKIIPKRSCIKEFILQLMKDESFLDKLYSLPGGTKQANLSVNHLNSITVSFPSIEEQEKIASCLSTLDAQITLQAEKIENLKQHKKGLMQRLFPNIVE